MRKPGNPLRIAIDARLTTGTAGGVEQTVIGMAHGLSHLTDGDEEYLFLAFADANDWICPYLDGRCRLLAGQLAPRDPGWKRVLKTAPLVRNAWHTLSAPLGRRAFRVPESDGTIERAAVDLIHFTLQTGFLTNVPSIYSPLDLQHLHLPGYFSPRIRMARELTYRTLCNQATMVVAHSTWGKHDLITQYQLPVDKVQIVPYAPAVDAYIAPTESDLAATRSKFSLPQHFLFYPAQTWPHKNHLGLLEALAIARDKHHVEVPLVCSGRQMQDCFPRIEKQVRQLGLSNQVKFLGFVSPQELQALYRLCRCLVFPSRFEGFGMPVLEAFRMGVPVACSKVTCLKALAGDAALTFDPGSPDQIAECALRLWTDQSLRETLIKRARERANAFSWQQTARIFRAHYRRLARRNVTDSDRALLASPPLL